jgi:hypothetical protein
MNSNIRPYTEKEIAEWNAKWGNVVLKTIYTKADLEWMETFLGGKNELHSHTD